MTKRYETGQHSPDLPDLTFADAVCTQPHIDPDLFFPMTEPDRLAAVAMCAACPRTDECQQLRESLPTYGATGVWHGVLFDNGRVRDRIKPRGRQPRT